MIPDNLLHSATATLLQELNRLIEQQGDSLHHIQPDNDGFYPLPTTNILLHHSKGKHRLDENANNLSHGQFALLATHNMVKTLHDFYHQWD